MSSPAERRLICLTLLLPRASIRHLARRRMADPRTDRVAGCVDWLDWSVGGAKPTQIGSSALPAARVLTVHRVDEGIHPEGIGEAAWMPVLRRVRAQVLEERLPPRLGVHRLGDSRTTWVNVSTATITAHCPAYPHRAILPDED